MIITQMEKNGAVHDIHDGRVPESVSTVDSTPTSGSGNLITSGGVKSYVDTADAHAVLWNQSQNLSASEKAQARANIHAIKPNEAVVNLLNPTLATTTLNGVTCTNNGDGTYTLNGTATQAFPFQLLNNTSFLKSGKSYKLLGTDKSNTNASIYVYSTEGNKTDTDGNGVVFSLSSVIGNNISIWVRVATYNNVIIKPMITTNLSATYDDFVEYGHYTQFGDLLWTNASPTSEFAGQTVSVNLSGYKFVLISGIKTIGEHVNFSQITEIGSYGSIQFSFEHNLYRVYQVSNNGILFQDGYYINSYATTPSIVNGYCVPIKIYGIR